MVKRYDIKDSNEGLPKELAVWLAKEREKELLHNEMMIRRNVADDKVFISYLMQIIPQLVKKRDQIMVYNLIRHKQAGKVFTSGQKGVITTLYLKCNKD